MKNIFIIIFLIIFSIKFSLASDFIKGKTYQNNVKNVFGNKGIVRYSCFRYLCII